MARKQVPMKLAEDFANLKNYTAHDAAMARIGISESDFDLLVKANRIKPALFFHTQDVESLQAACSSAVADARAAAADVLRDSNALIELTPNLEEEQRVALGIRLLGNLGNLDAASKKITKASGAERRKRTSPEDRERALADLTAKVALKEVAQKYGVAESTLLNWKRKQHQ